MAFDPEYLDHIISAVVLLVAFILLLGVWKFLNRRIGENRDNFLKQTVSHLKGPVQAFFIITVIYLVSRQAEYAWLQGAYATKAFTLTATALLTWLAIRIVHLVSTIMLSRFDTEARDNLNARMMHTQIRVLRRLATAIILIIGTASGLMIFEQIRALGVSLLASAGVAGIVLGLAAQKTIGNFFTGLQIAITQPIRIDDAVVVEGEWGWIEEINLTYVVVKIWDQRRLVLPISYFVENPFQNWTRKTSDILGTVILYLDYTMPLQPIRDELDRILGGTDLWDGKVKVVQVIDTSEKIMKVRILVSAADSPSAWDLRCLVREKMITYIQKKHPDHLPRLRAELASHEGIDKQRKTA